MRMSSRRFARIASVACLLACSPIAFAAKQSAAPQPTQAARVVDEKHQPIAGALVSLQEKPAVPLLDLARETTVCLTGVEGEYTYTAAPGAASIVFSAPGKASASFPAGSTIPNEVVLYPAERLSGFIITDRGTTVTDAVVGPATQEQSEAEPDGRQVPPLFARTDSRGRFIFDQLANGRYRLPVISKSACASTHIGSTGRPNQIIVIPSAGVPVTGSIIGSRSRAPLPGYYAEASWQDIRVFAAADKQGQFLFPLLPPREFNFRAIVSSVAQVSRPALVPQDFTVRATGAFHILDNPTTSARLMMDRKTPPLQLLVDEGIRLGGKVMDGDTSRPIAGIGLSLDTDPPSQASTDISGAFEFPNVSAFQDVIVRFENAAYTSESGADYLRMPASQDDITSLEVTLRKKSNATGKVVDVNGRAVAGASVLLKSLSAPSMRIGKQLVSPEYSALTNALGRFSCTVFPPGRFAVTASTPALVSDKQEVEIAGLLPAQITLRVYPSAVALGAVIDPAGAAVGSAEVHIAEEQDTQTVRITKTNAKGEFRFDGMRPRNVVLSAFHNRFVQSASATADLAVISSSSVKLQFPAGNELSAIVRAADQKPIANAEVHCWYTEGASGKSLRHTTGADGTVLISSIPVKQIDRIAVRSPGYVAYDAENVVLPAHDVAITLQKCGTISVLVDAMQSTPPVPATVILLAAHVAATNSVPIDADFTSCGEKRPTDGKTEFADLDPGWYKAAARQGTAYAESEPILVSAGKEPREIKLTFDPTASLKGRVIDKSTRAGVAGVVLKAIPAGQLPSAPDPITAISATDGSYEIRGVPIGRLTVSLIHPSYPPANSVITVPAGGRNGADLEISSQLSTLGGHVFSDGQPVSGALVVLYSRDENPVGKSNTDGTGAYQIGDLPSGDYQLVVEAPLGEGDHIANSSIDVKISEASHTVDVNVAKPTQVTGIVRSQSGHDTPKQLTFAPGTPGTTGGTADLRADGTFEIYLAPGSYNVGLEDRAGQQVTIPKSVTPYKLQLDF